MGKSSAILLFVDLREISIRNPSFLLLDKREKERLIFTA